MLTVWLSGLARDLRSAVRSLRAAPGVTAVVVASLAIGIGVNTTVFSWIASRVTTPLPGVARGGDFLLIEAKGETGSYPGLSWPDYRDLTERLPAFREVVAFRLAPLNVGAADWAERTYGVLVSGNYFTALELGAAAGRLIEPGDAASPGGAPVAVISHRFWQSRLAGAADVAGREMRVNDRVFTIVGVAPRGFAGTVMGLTFDVWVPATAAPILNDGSTELENRAQRGYLAMGDLRPGARLADARRDLDAAMRDLAAAFPSTNATIRGEVLPQWQSPRGPQQSIVAALAMFQGAMLLVLAVVVGNTANLVLTRAGARQHEAGVMLALGASRWRVVRLLLLEQVLVAAAGAALGALIAVWGTTALRAVPMPTPAGLELTFHTAVDGVTLAFASLLGLLSGLVIGLPAGLHLSRINPQAALRAGSTVTGRSTIRDVFLALEVALAVVALVVSALFLKNFNDTRTTDPGFRQAGVLLATYDLRGRDRAVSTEGSRDFSARLLDRLRQVPSVESVAFATSVPLDIHGMPSRFIAVEGRTRPDGEFDRVLTNTVSSGYFETMGIPFVEGVDFGDLRATRPMPEAIVNEEFVRQFVVSRSVLGRRIEAAGRTFTIVGVVRNSLYNAFGETTAPFMYLSLGDRPSPMVEIHAHTRSGAETTMANDIRAVVRELDEALPLYNVRTMTTHVDGNLVFRRVPARMFAVLGPLLLALVGIGIFAVAAHAVARRRREIGVRIALGGRSGRVALTLVVDTLRVVMLGMAGGVVAALMIDPAAGSGQAGERWWLAGVVMLFLAVAAVATWLPARRASRVDPALVLKEET
jgi:predicted permease